MNELSIVPSLRYITIRKKKIDLRKALAIDPENIDLEFQHHTEKFLFWKRVKDREHDRVKRLENQLKELEGTIFVHYWQNLEDQSRQFSDTLVRSYVDQNEDILAKRKEIERSWKRANELRSICDAFEHRRGMLMQLGAHIRRESTD